MSVKSDTSNKIYIITGAAGFIGYHLSEKILKEGGVVIGLDNLNEYYDVKLKQDRLSKLRIFSNFQFIKCDISEKKEVLKIFEEYKPQIVINLAAQAGVRYSIDNPDAYIKSNIIGFYNILEACRFNSIEHLIYASSSSVYGANKKIPFEESDFVDNPVSLYAATKKSNELMAHTYNHLYNFPITGLRFFTVYGPMGRPDMAYFGFLDKYFDSEKIKIFNNGDFENDLYRDFTYIDDIVEGISKILDKSSSFDSKHNVFNLGNNKPEKLMTFITTLETALGNSLGHVVEFEKEFEAIKPGDVPVTYASTELLQEAIDFKPKTTIHEGLQLFCDWYVDYYKK